MQESLTRRLINNRGNYTASPLYKQYPVRPVTRGHNRIFVRSPKKSYYGHVQQTPIVISGSIAIDRIMNFSGRYSDHIKTEKLDSLSISIFLNSMQDAYGGVGANIAYTLALLGEEPLLVGSVGKDALLYMEKLAHDGVNITHVFESTLPTAAFNVITDADQNQVGGFYPGAMFDSGSLTFAPWRQSNPIVVVAPHDPKAMKRQVQECVDWKLRLCYDIGQQVSNLPGNEMRIGVEAAEILILNDYEITVLTQKTGLSLEKIKKTVPIVVTTLGKRGSLIEGAKISEAVHVGVVKADQVADPTGAGDAFRSGFLYGYARNWPLKACAQLGACCGTYAVETVGTQSHTFSPSELTKRYESAFNEPLPARLSKE
jgi:adenosine kinase